MSYKLKNLKYGALLLVVALSISPRREMARKKTFPPLSLTYLKNVKIITTSNGNKIYTLKDLTYEDNRKPFITDIVLSFNYSSSRLRRDDTHKYNIRYANYNLVNGNGSLGKGSAQFFKKQHSIKILTVRNLWLGTCNDLGSFTIEFRFRPYKVTNGSILFSRLGYFSGKRRGIEISLRNDRIVAELAGIFDRPDGRNMNVIMKRGQILKKNTWYHFSLSYDRISGKLTKYINGKEEEVIYITESGDPYNGVYSPTFGYHDEEGNLACLDSPPAIIGKNYSGLIDEFRISYKHFEDLEKRTEIAYRNYHNTGIIGRIPFNVEGIITSPVYKFSMTGTKIIEFKWNEKLGRDTFIWMQFRISDRLFKHDSIDVKWYRINNNQKKIYLMKNQEGEFLRGKYYQWRAHLISSPDGSFSPQLSDVNIYYHLDVPPVTPMFLEVLKTSDRSVTLRWKKNMDFDIMGYKIYYGTMPGKYDGIISQISGNRITNSLSNGNYITLTITNNIIDENKSRDREQRFLYPILNNTVLYYFSVSAYDRYKPDTPYNHESELSKPITARPYAGSEIK